MVQLTADLENWHVGGVSVVRNDDEGQISKGEDHNECIDYEFGPLQVENQFLILCNCSWHDSAHWATATAYFNLLA
jgi:hypothetical protein